MEGDSNCPGIDILDYDDVFLFWNVGGLFRSDAIDLNLETEERVLSIKGVRIYLAHFFL